jgi:hypothetical protein
LSSAFSSLVLIACTARVHAQATPLNDPLVEEKEVLITCELTKPEPKANVPVFESAKESEETKGTWHYKLWLPKGYLADPAKRWPCMFVMSPSGGAAMGQMAAQLKSSGYVVVMPQEAKNGPWAPIVGNLCASHDDVIKRVRIQEGLKFATGFSGGARMSGLLAEMRPGFSGVILQGAAYPSDKNNRYHANHTKAIPGFVVAMCVGEKDPNIHEVKQLQTALPGARFHAFNFSGGHQWAPTAEFNEAFTWLEQQVYVDGPLRADLKPAYVSYFKTHFEQWNAMTAPWERYQAAETLLTFARARNLAMDPAVAPSVRQVQTEYSRLRSDPAIAKEAMAAGAWHRLEESYHGNVDPARVAADCRDFAKRYPGTEAARKAEEKAAKP